MLQALALTHLRQGLQLVDMVKMYAPAAATEPGKAA